MKKNLLTNLLLLTVLMTAHAEERTIDISGNNTSSDYKSYSTSISLPASDIVNVKMARYCYFSSTITGKGVLNLYGGGERCYLGTAKGAKWADWSIFTGDIHIYPFKENSSSAGFYGVVLAHGGKSFSPENIDLSKVNTAMQNNHVTLHKDAVICTEANTAGAGFRIGELQTEEGSTLQGYMKNSRAAYYLLGCKRKRRERYGFFHRRHAVVRGDNDGGVFQHAGLSHFPVKLSKPFVYRPETCCHLF